MAAKRTGLSGRTIVATNTISFPITSTVLPNISSTPEYTLYSAPRELSTPAIRPRDEQPEFTNYFSRLLVYYNTRHYGYISDLIQGIRDTKYYTSDLASNNSVTQSPVICRFYKNEKIIAPTVTACSNIDEESRIFGPYIDEEIPEDQIQRTEYIDVSDVLTTTEI